jgi:hypothetical protein
MQTIIHAYCRSGSSLRDKIAKDGTRLSKFSLDVVSQKSPTRSRGWSKLKSLDGKDGAINVEWDQDARVLICRVVTRGGNPAPIIADFVEYLMSRHFGRIRTLILVPAAGR